VRAGGRDWGGWHSSAARWQKQCLRFSYGGAGWCVCVGGGGEPSDMVLLKHEKNVEYIGTPPPPVPCFLYLADLAHAFDGARHEAPVAGQDLVASLEAFRVMAQRSCKIDRCITHAEPTHVSERML
jgi:hypothetical protein